MNYRIDEIEGIGATYAGKLQAAGIRNTSDFLTHCCDRSGRTHIATQTGVSEKLLLKWANLADLMRVTGIGKQFAELLEAAGVDTIKELRNRNAANLASTMAEVNAAKKLARSTPSMSMVEEWIAQAKLLPPTITH